jgi:hypothetical protein
VQARPPIVWVFVAYNAILPVVWRPIWGFPTFDSGGSWAALVATVAVVALALYWFVRGVRLVWWLSVVAFALAFIPTGQSAGRYWLGVILSLVALGMLLAPSMRGYFFQKNAAASS